MMNRGHAATGLLAGIAATTVTASATGTAVEPVTYAVAGLVTAGASLVPDIDHDKSTITRCAGPASRTIAEVLQWIARRTYAATRTAHDPDGDGEHRGLIHTPAFALVLGAFIALGTVISPWCGLAVVGLMLTAAISSLRWCLPDGVRTALKLHWCTAPVAYALAGMAGLVHLGALEAVGPHLGVLVALGAITHSLGDGLTNSGIPFAWPLRLPCTRGCSPRRGCRGQRWRRLGVLPAGLRFATGSVVERGVELASLLAAGGLLAVHLA